MRTLPNKGAKKAIQNVELRRSFVTQHSQHEMAPKVEVKDKKGKQVAVKGQLAPRAQKAVQGRPDAPVKVQENSEKKQKKEKPAKKEFQKEAPAKKEKPTKKENPAKKEAPAKKEVSAKVKSADMTDEAFKNLLKRRARILGLKKQASRSEESEMPTIERERVRIVVENDELDTYKSLVMSCSSPRATDAARVAKLVHNVARDPDAILAALKAPLPPDKSSSAA
jgi:hypothetical protein